MQKIFISIILILILFIPNGKAQNIETEFLYRITLKLDTSINLGNLGIGERVIYPIIGGTFDGPIIKGKVRPAGTDWMLLIDSNTTKLDVRLMLETDDGALIYNTYSGILTNKPDGTTYWRTIPIFETSSTKYKWLNNILSIGAGDMNVGVSYNVFMIK